MDVKMGIAIPQNLDIHLVGFENTGDRLLDQGHLAEELPLGEPGEFMQFVNMRFRNEIGVTRKTLVIAQADDAGG